MTNSERTFTSLNGEAIRHVDDRPFRGGGHFPSNPKEDMHPSGSETILDSQLSHVAALGYRAARDLAPTASENTEV